MMHVALARINLILLVLVLVVASPLSAQQAVGVAPPGLEAIQAEDLRSDLFVFASDEMRGRRAGTLDELRSGAWLAEQARAAGLEPAGDDGTYFQYFHVLRHYVDPGSRVTVGGRNLRWKEEVVAVAPVTAVVQAPMVRYGNGSDLRGRVVIIQPDPPADATGEREDIAALQHLSQQVFRQLPMVMAAGPAAIVVVPDSVTARAFGMLAHALGDGSFGLEEDQSGHMNLPLPLLLVHPAALADLDALEGSEAVIDMTAATALYPSVNVVAKAPGTDLRDEYILFSAHHDHDGVGIIDGEEAIWNGADDNGSGSVALLAIGRAFREAPARRSALFVWHGAEERGLLGSRFFAQTPTVDRDGIVAVLNADMIGRNHPDSAAVLGVLPGNRNSTDLANAAMAANEAVTGFVVDHSYDEPDNPENFWQRSDHYPYVMAGFPALFFTTGLHPDYHTPADTADLIDYDKLAQMARWIYATGWIVAMADERPALDGR